MKTAYKLAACAALATTALVSCQDLEDVNVSPNNPSSVPSNMLMSGTEKFIVDYIYDNWFSARQCLVYSQQWAQRNYTEEDRYQIRESVNNSYFNYLYMGIGSLNKVIELNTDEATATTNSSVGANCNQIAAARILKAWTMSVITDTWGAVPYSDISKLESDGVIYCKYDDQATIYADLIKELTEAAAQIDESEVAFTSGDMIFYGDASKWKKFAGSLKCRLALHLSKVDSNWKTYIAEALESGVMESNDDVAAFHYSSSGTEYCQFYAGWYVDGRNDFTINARLVDLLKGQPDTLNAKSHPWEGTLDPRLSVFTTDNDGVIKGFPMGVTSAQSSAVRTGTPNWYANPPMHLNADYAVPLMTYAEQKFIESEYNGFDADDYKAGVEASLEYWTGSVDDDYVSAVSAKVDAEAVSIQKYIDLFTNGTEAWTEIRRTGYPEQLLRPGEIAAVYENSKGTVTARFEPLSETKGDIISRVKYPTNESTLNGANWTEAVSKLDDGTNNYYTKMIFDVRKSTYDHPANL